MTSEALQMEKIDLDLQIAKCCSDQNIAANQRWLAAVTIALVASSLAFSSSANPNDIEIAGVTLSKNIAVPLFLIALSMVNFSFVVAMTVSHFNVKIPTHRSKTVPTSWVEDSITYQDYVFLGVHSNFVRIRPLVAHIKNIKIQNFAYLILKAFIDGIYIFSPVVALLTLAVFQWNMQESSTWSSFIVLVTVSISTLSALSSIFLYFRILFVYLLSAVKQA